jgi:hypothetical protein
MSDKKCGFENFGYEKNCGTKMLVTKVLGLKKLCQKKWDTNTNLGTKKLGQKKIGYEKKCGTKILVSKNVGTKVLVKNK